MKLRTIVKMEIPVTVVLNDDASPEELVRVVKKEVKKRWNLEPKRLKISIDVNRKNPKY